MLLQAKKLIPAHNLVICDRTTFPLKYYLAVSDPEIQDFGSSYALQKVNFKHGSKRRMGQDLALCGYQLIFTIYCIVLKTGILINMSFSLRQQLCKRR